MVTLDVVRACNAALVKSQPIVAVFAGATSGIGEYTLRALAAVHGTSGKGLRAYLVGRNEAIARKIIEDCQKLCPPGEFRFVKAQNLALLRDVDSICAEITRAEEAAVAPGQSAKIDLLVMSHAHLAFEARQETEEGLDTLMSLLYYSRARFTIQLLPLLLASPLPARVVSVFGPGRDVKLFPDDLSLRNPQLYGFMNMGSHAAYMITFFMEHLAAAHPDRLALAHYFPGLVITDGFKSERLPGWFRFLWRLLQPFVRPFTVPQAESGERVLFHTSPQFPARSAAEGATEPAKRHGDVEVAVSSDGVRGGGAYRTGWDARPVPLGKLYEKLRPEGFSETVWTHTMKAFEVIEAGGVFTE